MVCLRGSVKRGGARGIPSAPTGQTPQPTAAPTDYRRGPCGNELIRAGRQLRQPLVLLLANFFLLELVDDPRWGAIGSTLLAASRSSSRSATRIRETGQRRQGSRPRMRRTRAARADHQLDFGRRARRTCCQSACSSRRPCPSPSRRILKHRRVTRETVLGALCAYVLRRAAVRVHLSRRERISQRAVLRTTGPASAVGVPLLQLRHDDDARLRRPLARGRPAAGADRARGSSSVRSSS